MCQVLWCEGNKDESRVTFIWLWNPLLMSLRRLSTPYWIANYLELTRCAVNFSSTGKWDKSSAIQCQPQSMEEEIEIDPYWVERMQTKPIYLRRKMQYDRLWKLHAYVPFSISLLSIAGKVFARMFLNRLTSHISEENITREAMQN